MDLLDAARALVRSPFTGDPTGWRRARDRMGDADVQALLVERIARGDRAGAELVVLAVGHTGAIDGPESAARALEASLFTPAIARALGRDRNAYLRIVLAAGRCHRALDAMQGTSDAMQRVRAETWAACFGDSLVHALTLERVIRDHDVVIVGETGTGKESIAGAIQDALPGAPDGSPAPRATLNAAAVPDTLVESELFGHVKGAFTGAGDTRRGRIRTAHGGSFFLDEVGDLPVTTQVKLLRVMETDEISPLGSDATHRADVRWIAATHKDLASMALDGRFRLDLYQRLAGNVIRLPPLRERPEDIPEIGMAFVRRHLASDAALADTTDRIERWLRSPEALGHAWRGNVRELFNALRNLLLGLPPGFDGASSATRETPSASADIPPRIGAGAATLREVEDWYIARALRSAGGNLAAAARTLGIDRATVRRRLGSG